MPKLFQYNGRKWIEIAQRGERGFIGLKGEDGETPISGIDFILPKDGKDGSSDKPEDIKKKLIKLPIFDKWFSAEHIKGLDRAKLSDAQIKKILLRASGGGDIINVQDLSSDTDGSNKSFVVNEHRKALMLFSSDDPIFLFEGNGFTISSRNLTWVPSNAPSSNSQLFFLYVT